MTDIPDAGPDLDAESEHRYDSAPDAPSLLRPTEGDSSDFDFWRDVIGDDIVCGGVVYSSDAWTHDGEGDVRPLTAAEKAVREANRRHPGDPDHPEVAAAYAALNTERHEALQAEHWMAEAIGLWNLELETDPDHEDPAERLQRAPASQPTVPAPARPVRRRYRGPRSTARR